VFRIFHQLEPTTWTSIAQPPPAIASGHRCGDDFGSAERAVVVRADSDRGTTGYLARSRERNVHFSGTAGSNPQVTAAVFDSIERDVERPLFGAG